MPGQGPFCPAPMLAIGVEGCRIASCVVLADVRSCVESLGSLSQAALAEKHRVQGCPKPDPGSPKVLLQQHFRYLKAFDI